MSAMDKVMAAVFIVFAVIGFVFVAVGIADRIYRLARWFDERVIKGEEAIRARARLERDIKQMNEHTVSLVVKIHGLENEIIRLQRELDLFKKGTYRGEDHERARSAGGDTIEEKN